MATTIDPPESTLVPVLRKAESAIRLEPVSQARFALLEVEWDDFHARTQVPSPFQSWDYLHCWWQVYGDKGYDVKMFIARDSDGKIIGAAPLMITRRGAFAGSRAKFRHLAFMGGVGELLGESLELPALPGYEQALGEATADLIVSSFSGQWDAMYFYLVPETSASTRAMLDRLATHGVATKKTHSLPSPCVTVDGTWDDHMAARPTKFASRVRYIRSYAQRRFDLKLHDVTDVAALDDAMDHLVRLAVGRWGDEAQAFHTPDFIEFHRQFAHRFLAKGQLSFGLVEMKDEIAGAAYNFVYDDKMWGYQAPWDTAFKAARAGNLLHICTTQKTFAMGLREYDTLPGDSGYKDEWANSSHTLDIYEGAHPGSLGGTLFKMARRLDKILKHKTQPAS